MIFAILSQYCKLLVSVAAAHRGHRVGEVLEPQVVRREQPRRAAGDHLADAHV